MATLYFNATASGDPSYSNVANWWTNVGATIPAGTIPSNYDDIIVQTPMISDSNSAYIGVNTAIFNNNTYLDSVSYYFYPLSANVATFNGNSYITLNSGITNYNNQLGNAVFNNTATNRGGYVFGTATFNYLTATFNGSGYAVTDITGYGVGNAVLGAFDKNNILINIVNFVNTDFQSDGFMQNEYANPVAINFYDNTVNYGSIFGTATFYDYSQNFGSLDGLPVIVYPNPNVVVGGQYFAGQNTGAIYVGYGIYFNNIIITGGGDSDFGNVNNWFQDGTTPLGFIPSSSLPLTVSVFDCSILTNTYGSASLDTIEIYGNTQLAIDVSATGLFYNNSFNTGTLTGTLIGGYVEFYNSSHNAGTINIDTTGNNFYDNSYNSGTINNSQSITFNGNSYNSNIVTGTSAFYGNSYNSGQVGTAGGTTASFHDASQNQGVIGSTSPSAISNGDFNNTSINIGSITGNARFRYVTATSGVAVDITGYANGPVNGTTYDSANNVITTWKFQGTDFMQSGATVTGNAIFVQNTGASGISVCLITGNAIVTSPAQRPLQATVLGSITYVGYGGPPVNIFVMLNFPFPLNYILGKTNPFGVSSLLKLPFYINK